MIVRTKIHSKQNDKEKSKLFLGKPQTYWRMTSSKVPLGFCNNWSKRNFWGFLIVIETYTMVNGIIKSLQEDLINNDILLIILTKPKKQQSFCLFLWKKFTLLY